MTALRHDSISRENAAATELNCCPLTPTCDDRFLAKCGGFAGLFLFHEYKSFGSIVDQSRGGNCGYRLCGQVIQPHQSCHSGQQLESAGSRVFECGPDGGHLTAAVDLSAEHVDGGVERMVGMGGQL